MTPMNQLPIKIDSIGRYLTATGKVAVIHAVEDHSDDYSVTRFNCKGHILTRHPSGRTTKRYMIWHESGRTTGLGSSPYDIINKESPN